MIILLMFPPKGCSSLSSGELPVIKITDWSRRWRPAELESCRRQANAEQPEEVNAPGDKPTGSRETDEPALHGIYVYILPVGG